MVKIRQAIVVEGRYDKNALSQIVDTAIFQTNGFGIMKDTEQLALLRAVAKKRGLIVFTDSDGAGFVIRNYLKSAIEPKFLLHAYIPDIHGKEKRKKAPGKEGKLGVEGMTPQIILDSLRKAGATIDDQLIPSADDPVTKQDLVEWGLSGGSNSAEKRNRLLRELNLPEHMSCNAMLQALQILYTRNEAMLVVRQLLEKSE